MIANIVLWFSFVIAQKTSHEEILLEFFFKEDLFYFYYSFVVFRKAPFVTMQTIYFLLFEKFCKLNQNEFLYRDKQMSQAIFGLKQIFYKYLLHDYKIIFEELFCFAKYLNCLSF